MDEEKKISDLLPPTEILSQMGEECSELSQAALKLRRALDGSNPTPKPAQECWEALQEEFGDVLNCVKALLDENNNEGAVDRFISECLKKSVEKMTRWNERLNEHTVLVNGWPVCRKCCHKMEYFGHEVIAGVDYLHYGCKDCYNQRYVRRAVGDGGAE